MRLTTHMTRYEVAATRPDTFHRIVARTITPYGDSDDWLVTFELEPIGAQPMDDAERRELWSNKSDEAA